MANTTKKLEIGDLPARAKVLDEAEAAEVFGGAAIKRGRKKRPPARKKPTKGRKRPPVKKPGKRPPPKKRPTLGPVKRKL